MKARWTVIALAAAAVTAAAWAQQPDGNRQGPRGPGDRRGGRGQGGGGMLAAFWQLRQFDTNGDLVLSDQEVKDGIDKVKDQADAAYAILLKAFDANGDGKIDGDEQQKVQDFATALTAIQRFDQNRDCRLSDEEMSAALDQVVEASQRLNDAVLRRFDKDKNGQLSAAEIAAAKDEMQSRMQPRRDDPPGPPPPEAQPPAERKP